MTLRWSAFIARYGKAQQNVFNKSNRMDFSGHEFLGGKWLKKIFERYMPLNHKMKFVQKWLS
jgi:tRNA nucleotidyltransferase (CCA-adding enzyme)